MQLPAWPSKPNELCAEAPPYQTIDQTSKAGAACTHLVTRVQADAHFRSMASPHGGGGREGTLDSLPNEANGSTMEYIGHGRSLEPTSVLIAA